MPLPLAPYCSLQRRNVRFIGRCGPPELGLLHFSLSLPLLPRRS
jgi:hypothetical protein